MRLRHPHHSATCTLLLLVASGCDPDTTGPSDDDATEIITSVRLTLTPQGGDAATEATFTDPDGDGGVSGTADPIVLSLGVRYALEIAFLDTLGDRDVTNEVAAEAQDHQVFVLGSAVVGPAMANDAALCTHAYADTESTWGPQTGEDLPVGLDNTLTADAAGSGTLQIMLRHLPPLNGMPQKVAGLAQDLAEGLPLPGEVDALVAFELTVQ